MAYFSIHPFIHSFIHSVATLFNEIDDEQQRKTLVDAHVTRRTYHIAMSIEKVVASNRSAGIQWNWADRHIHTQHNQPTGRPGQFSDEKQHSFLITGNFYLLFCDNNCS